VAALHTYIHILSNHRNQDSLTWNVYENTNLLQPKFKNLREVKMPKTWHKPFGRRSEALSILFILVVFFFLDLFISLREISPSF